MRHLKHLDTARAAALMPGEACVLDGQSGECEACEVEQAIDRRRNRSAPPSRYEHLMADFDKRPRELARHLRDDHGIEPKAARKGYERGVWHSQHEYDAHELCGAMVLDSAGPTGYGCDLLMGHSGRHDRRQP